MMNADVLSCVALLLSLSAAEPLVEVRSVPGLVEVRSVPGSDAVLGCTAAVQPGVQYRAVRWYKAGDPPAPRLSGLLTRDLPNGTTRWYIGVEREVELLAESRSILLPNVTCGDRGRYTCHLAAPVGEQNRDGEVLLTVTDCPDGTMEHLTTDACMVIVATAVLVFALLIFIISYVSLRNLIRDKGKITKKETLLDAPLRPLEKKDLMLIYTLGPKSSSTTKHVCV